MEKAIPFIILGFNVLILILIALVGVIGKGFNKRFDKVDQKFEVVFSEFKDYQTKEICEIHRTGIENKVKENACDINKVGKKLSTHIEQDKT